VATQIRDAAVMAFHPAAVQGADGMVMVALVDQALHVDLAQGLVHGENLNVRLGQRHGGLGEQTGQPHVAADAKQGA
jgi:hypothetical protein